MSASLGGESHKDHAAELVLKTLPRLWNLLDKVKVESQSDFSDVSCVVVPFRRHKDGSWQLLASEAVPETALSKALEGFVVQNHSSSRECFSDGKQYVLVPLPQHVDNIPKQRVSLQFGLNCAQHLSHYVKQGTSLGFAADENLCILQVLQGFLSGLYEISGFKSANHKLSQDSQKQSFTLERMVCVGQVDNLTSVVDLVKAQVVTRHLGDSPANYLLPKNFAAVAEHFAKVFGIDELTIFDKKRLEELKMYSLLSVSQGSLNEPKVIVAKVSGTNPTESKPVVIVGKGVTFDSGGISLKPPAGMGEMKYDMLGGATVFGALCYLATQKRPPHDTIALIGCVENMPAQYATRPGDVVTSYSGKTIEILNTDAEGRLVMADLLSYGEKTYEPQCMMDMATLTGACLVALGSVGAALMGNHGKFTDYIKDAAEDLGVPLCQMPLWPDLAKAVDSSVADVKNIASSNVRAGTITAGIFLSKFVSDSTPWSHFDIAGVGWDAQIMGYPSKGASGYGVELLSYIAQNASEVLAS